jgi:hypothetical protein
VETIKDLAYWKNNCEENYLTTPISVLRYIAELEKSIQLMKTEVIESVCDYCEPVSGYYLGMTCPKCMQGFRSVKQTVL